MARRDHNCLLLGFMLLALTVVCISDVYPLSDDNINYAVKNIPAALLDKADAVIRLKRRQLEVKSKSRASYKAKFAVTIFKKEERGQGTLVIHYDKFGKLDDLEGCIYDAEGKVVKELEDEDIEDYPSSRGYTLYSDTRTKYAQLYHDQYPYTVEYSYEILLDGYINWPEWRTYSALEAVELTQFEITMPEGLQLRYWCNRDSLKPEIIHNGGQSIYKWEARNLPRLSKDAVGDEIEDIAGIVKVAPAEFSIDGYSGNMSSWKDFGLWYCNLCKNKDKLPGEAINDVQRIAGETKDTLSLVKRLYEYMQNRTRYVNVRLGIGGWQPFDASYVHERGYGDCKALSNYMVALLKQAGIKAYMVLIKSGRQERPMVSEFPSNQFDHVIACVPLSKDTLWLECTSQIMPFGRSGAFTENRQALMITPEGGVLVNIPGREYQDNLQSRYTRVTINLNGSADAKSQISWRGDQQYDTRLSVFELSPEDRKKWIVNSVDIADARLVNFSFSGIESKDTLVSLTADFVIPRFSSASGSRMFFQPNIMDRRTTVPADVKERLTPLRFSYPYINIDTVTYAIPEGYTPESLPVEVHIKKPFGEYSSRAVFDGASTITYYRSYIVKDYTIPADKYAEYRKYIQEIVKADRAQIVLVKKQ